MNNEAIKRKGKNFKLSVCKGFKCISITEKSKWSWKYPKEIVKKNVTNCWNDRLLVELGLPEYVDSLCFSFFPSIFLSKTKFVNFCNRKSLKNLGILNINLRCYVHWKFLIGFTFDGEFNLHVSVDVSIISIDKSQKRTNYENFKS